MEFLFTLLFFLLKCFTFSLWWRGATVQPQHDWSKGHVSLHTVLPDHIDDGGREVNVKVTQKHNAVVILRIRTRIYCSIPPKHLWVSHPHFCWLGHSRLSGQCLLADRRSARSFQSASRTRTWVTRRCINSIQVLLHQDKWNANTYLGSEDFSRAFLTSMSLLL